jgi:hypothetical protein
MTFGNWSSDIHKRPEQVLRICTGQKIPKFKIDIHDDKESATIQGSSPEPYYVTLNSCTCSDFSYRKLPCKHIYAFVIAAGIVTL